LEKMPSRIEGEKIERVRGEGVRKMRDKKRKRKGD